MIAVGFLRRWAAPFIVIAALGAAAAGAQDGNGGQNTSGPTAAQVRAAPIDLDDQQIRRYRGNPVGEFFAVPNVQGFGYQLPDGSVALLANCSPQQRCEAAVFYWNLGQTSEERLDEIDETLFGINAIYNPADQQMGATRNDDGTGQVVMPIRLTNSTSADYFHSRYSVFLEGLATLVEEGFVTRTTEVSGLAAQWGSYAAAADVEWWLEPHGGFAHFSWAVPGEQMRLEAFDRWGTRTFSSVLTVNGDTISGPGWATLRFTSREALKSVFADGRIEEIDDELYSKTITTVQNGSSSEWRSTATIEPRFPDAATRARVNGQPACPPTKAALAQLLARQRVLTDLPSGGIDAGQRTFSPDGMTVLGMRPTSVEAATSGGVVFDLEVMLPVADPRRLEQVFRASFSTGQTYCSQYDGYGTCDWRPSGDVLAVPSGHLVSAGITRTIYSDTETRFMCSYRY